MREFRQTWLCPEPADRERLLEVDERLRSAQAGFWAALSLALVAFVPRWGVGSLAPLVGAVVAAALLRRYALGRVAPEYVIAGIGAFSQLMLGVGIARSGGATSPVLPIMLVAATLVPARFTGRPMKILLAFAALCMVVPCVVHDPAALTAHPELLVACICGMIGMAPMVAALTGSEREQRAEASLDALTGLPNRRALASSFPAIVRGAEARGARVAVMACDVDHFKRVNDTHGHVRGDRVLQALAETLQAVLRGSDAAFRWGGEEFVLVAVTPTERAARDAAERLRARVAASGFDGLPLTVSIGVALVEPGQDLQASFDRADAALYRAKELGRDRVVLASDEVDATASSLPAAA